MGKLGISIYPERSTFEKRQKAYLIWLIKCQALSVSLSVYCKINDASGKRY